MPGINKWRTLDLMNRSINSRKLMVRTVKERARKTIELVQKCAQNAPEVLDLDVGPFFFELDEYDCRFSTEMAKSAHWKAKQTIF